MAKTRRRVVFSRDGVAVEEDRESPLSNDQRTVTIDELRWEEFPADGLQMEVLSVEPVPSDVEGGGLAELRFQVADLSRTGPSSATDSPFRQRVAAATGIALDDDAVSLNGDVSAKANLVAFVGFLFENGYLTREDLPISSGWKRYLVNDEPKHKDGSEMAQYEEVASDIFVETKYSRAAIREKIRELTDEFGG